VDIVWKRVEGLRQAQDLLVTHIENMKRNSDVQGEIIIEVHSKVAFLFDRTDEFLYFI
jgi:hypothetical protein